MYHCWAMPRMLLVSQYSTRPAGKTKNMPLVFSVMFFVFPAGLVLYWLTNNILGIAQQWYINKRLGVA